MKTSPLTAHAIGAATYPSVVVHREVSRGGPIISHEKGGYILMWWERNIAHPRSTPRIVREERMIQVTMDRAIQAAIKLDAGYKIV